MTVGQFVGVIAGVVAGLVAFIKGIEYLHKKISEAATQWLQNGLAPTNAKIDALDKKVDAAELEDCKNYLVSFLSDVKLGNKVTEVERERFHETYKRYTDMGGNSYIHTEVENLKKIGKL